MSNLITENRTQPFFNRPVWTAWCAVVMSAGIMFGVSGASADPCMQDNAGFNLNCKANDVRIASASNIEILDDGCAYPGDTVDFSATFEVLLGAQARHDVGLYFAIDGDPNSDGALTGICAADVVPFVPDPPWLDLDGTNDPWPGDNKPSGIQDVCGDIDAHPDHNPLFPTVTLHGVACIDPDSDGKLNLPNCTSWRQPGSNELCQGVIDAYPGSPSKCRCDIGFNVDIDVPEATLLVTKTAVNATDATLGATVDEPGGAITFTVSVTNTSIDPENDVTLNSLIDTIYGDITQVGGDLTATTCALPQTLEGDDANPGGIDTYVCSFTANVTGNAGVEETNEVTASGLDSRVPQNSIKGTDTATVTINDVQPVIAVIKTAVPDEVLEPGGTVTFSVLVTSTSVSSDPVTIDSLIDNVHGDLNGQGTCSVPQTIAGGGTGTYSCSFSAYVAGNTGYVETDTVTASGEDDEGNPASESESATVTVLNVPSEIELIKTASPTSLDEPGGNVTYTYTVNNTSSVDTVTIKDYEEFIGLSDDILGNLDGMGDCSVPQRLEPDDEKNGGPDTYTCTVVVPVTGDAFDAITNTATANGLDDDGVPVTASVSATVNIDNVQPAASLTKTVTEVLVTYTVEVCNDSDAESLTLDALEDIPYGDITNVNNPAIANTGCSVPQVLTPVADGECSDGVDPDDCYCCTFKAATTTSPTTDTVTGTVNDDDGSQPSEPSHSATVSFE